VNKRTIVKRAEKLVLEPSISHLEKIAVTILLPTRLVAQPDSTVLTRLVSLIQWAITVVTFYNASVVDLLLLAKTVLVFNSVFPVTNALLTQTVTSVPALVPMTFALVWVSVPNVVLVEVV
jgi:hypothetical protein